MMRGSKSLPRVRFRVRVRVRVRGEEGFKKPACAVGYCCTCRWGQAFAWHGHCGMLSFLSLLL